MPMVCGIDPLLEGPADMSAMEFAALGLSVFAVAVQSYRCLSSPTSTLMLTGRPYSSASAG